MLMKTIRYIEHFNLALAATLDNFIRSAGISPNISEDVYSSNIGAVLIGLILGNKRKNRSIGRKSNKVTFITATHICVDLDNNFICYIFERGYHPTKHLQNRYQRPLRER